MRKFFFKFIKPLKFTRTGRTGKKLQGYNVIQENDKIRNATNKK